MNKRMNRSRLNIGAYHLRPYARTEQHIKELAECGIDFIACMENDRATLDLFEKYGIGAMLNDVVPGWWGGDGSSAGQLEATNPMEKYEEAAAKFVDHPAIWAIDIGDEPSALDFPYYGKVFSKVNQCFPNQFPYLNLYPNYASVSQNSENQTLSQLGTATYEEHIAAYCQNVPSDYICYDFYPYSINVDRHYQNLRVVADAARNTGRSMWIVLQVNSNKPEEWISENRLRFQAYSAMAFGAENIIWACYTAGWWHNQVLDEKGNKTEQYEKLKKINAEIHAIAEEYMRYRRTETYFVGFDEDFGNRVYNCKSLDALNTGVFYGVNADSPLIVGEMISREKDGSVALMICAAGDPYDRNPEKVTVRFRVEKGRTLQTFVGKEKMPLTKEADGSYSVEISSCSGLLITAK